MTAVGRRTTLALALMFVCPVLTRSETAERAFARNWEGRNVVVTFPLYTLVYNERGKLGQTYHGRRDGLTVMTPSQGWYLQFDGRQGRDDVKANDPVKLFDAVNAAYEADSLDLRSYRKIEPVVVNRYDPGVELVVIKVKVDRDIVRLSFARSEAGPELATSLTIKWPVLLSKSFSERDVIESLIRRFVDIKTSSVTPR